MHYELGINKEGEPIEWTSGHSSSSQPAKMFIDFVK